MRAEGGDVGRDIEASVYTNTLGLPPLTLHCAPLTGLHFYLVYAPKNMTALLRNLN